MTTLFYGAIDLLDEDGPYSAQVGTSMGSWKSIQTETTSPFLDGAAVSGDATANREIKLLVAVTATSWADLIMASETLIGEANKPFNTLTWTHPGAASAVYDTFRVRSPDRSDDEAELDDDDVMVYRREYELTIPAYPFVRSAVLETPTAIAPVAVDLAVFSATSGFAGFGDADLAFGRPDTQMGGVTPVSGCTITTPTDGNGDHCVKLNPTGSGPMEARSVNTVSVSAAGVGLTLVLGYLSPIAGLQVGIEWFNGATSLYVDWGPVRASGNFTLEAMSARPSAATKVGYRIRTTDSTVAPFLTSLRLGTRASVSGDANLGFIADSTAPFTPQKRIDIFAERLVLASSAVLTGQPTLTVWAKRASGATSITGSALHVRLHSGTAGNWSGWTTTFTSADDSAWADGTWRALTFDLTTPTQLSAVGAVSLAAVNAVTLFSDALLDIGAIGAGITTGAGTGPRGTVFDLAIIKGSAPAAAMAHAWSTTALTDLIIMTLDALDGPPMVAIASSAAVLTGQYNGVYRMLVSRTDATAPTTPQLVLTQKIGATTVATVTLPGKTRPGNHYVDFGTVPLPLVAVPDENVSVTYTVALTPTSANWGEILPLNVNNSLVMLEQINPARKHTWVDEPEIIVGIGDVWVGTVDRTDASAPLQAVDQSSPFTVKAPNVKLLVYSTAASPSASLSYHPRYVDGLV